MSRVSAPAAHFKLSLLLLCDACNKYPGSLLPGNTSALTLTFEKAGNISVTVPVRAMGAMQDDKAGMGGMHDWR